MEIDVNELRELHYRVMSDSSQRHPEWFGKILAAADEIERLRAKVASASADERRLFAALALDRMIQIYGAEHNYHVAANEAVTAADALLVRLDKEPNDGKA